MSTLILFQYSYAAKKNISRHSVRTKVRRENFNFSPARGKMAKAIAFDGSFDGTSFRLE